MAMFNYHILSWPDHWPVTKPIPGYRQSLPSTPWSAFDWINYIYTSALQKPAEMLIFASVLTSSKEVYFAASRNTCSRWAAASSIHDFHLVLVTARSFSQILKPTSLLLGTKSFSHFFLCSFMHSCGLCCLPLTFLFRDCGNSTHIPGYSWSQSKVLGKKSVFIHFLPFNLLSVTVLF